LKQLVVKVHLIRKLKVRNFYFAFFAKSLRSFA
jgi:hypothetical protein